MSSKLGEDDYRYRRAVKSAKRMEDIFGVKLDGVGRGDLIITLKLILEREARIIRGLDKP